MFKIVGGERAVKLRVWEEFSDKIKELRAKRTGKLRVRLYYDEWCEDFNYLLESGENCLDLSFLKKEVLNKLDEVSKLESKIKDLSKTIEGQQDEIQRLHKTIQNLKTAKEETRHDIYVQVSKDIHGKK